MNGNISLENQEVRQLRTPLRRSIELHIGESQQVELYNGQRVTVKLLRIEETRDRLRSAVRMSRAKVDVDGKDSWVNSGNYNLPTVVGDVLIDCPVTRGYLKNSSGDNKWALAKDARFRLWPVGSPLVAPGTFVSPIKQRWFASDSQMSNEPTFVNGGENPTRSQIYYHWGLDFGGAEGMTDVLSAVDGMVILSGKQVLNGYEEVIPEASYDGVYIVDDRGWFHGYFHLKTITAQIRKEVHQGEKIGLLGKEGRSGGWSHLHYVIKCPQPSGEWGVEESYAFVWEAYVGQYSPALVAVARPHQLVGVGDTALFDGRKSWSSSGEIVNYRWIFTDGTTATDSIAKRRYDAIGTYSEILEVTDSNGQTSYDFAKVQVLEGNQSKQAPPSIHAAYSPTLNIQPGEMITFRVRSFNVGNGREVWDFGDGSQTVTVQSDGNVDSHAENGYAIAFHSYREAGGYLARVERRDAQDNVVAISHLFVRVSND